MVCAEIYSSKVSTKLETCSGAQ